MRWIRNKKITKKNTIQVPADTLQEGKSYLLRVTSGAHIAIFEGRDPFYAHRTCHVDRVFFYRHSRRLVFILALT